LLENDVMALLFLELLKKIWAVGKNNPVGKIAKRTVWRSAFF